MSKKDNTDVVLLGPPTPDGKGLHVIRAREDRIEAGEVRPIKEGQPIAGEIVRLAPREDAPQICDVETLYAPPASPSATESESKERGVSHGPAQVATKAYRDQWSRVFGDGSGNAASAGEKKTPPKSLN